MSNVSNMETFMEAIARGMKGDLPTGYGYRAGVPLGVGFYVNQQTGCNLLEKPVVVPRGDAMAQGYLVMYSYCSKEGMESLLEGQLPPIMPATSKEPAQFQSLAAIADNFGMANPQAKANNSKYCVAFRVPAELATQVDTPGRDLWIIRFDQDVISPFLQAAKEGDAIKVGNALKAGIKGTTMDEHGVTALMMAAMAGSAPTCKLLIDNGADVNAAEPKSSRTALMFAAQGGKMETVKLLLACKADASMKDDEGSSALTWAAVANHADVAKVLADHSRHDNRCNTSDAISVAEKMGHKETLAVLKV